MFRKFAIKKNERALLLRKGEFEKILYAGEYRVFDPFLRYAVERFDLAKPLFEHKLAQYLVNTDRALVDREFTVVELGPNEVGLRYEDGLLTEVLAPNTRKLYWKGYIDVRVTKLDIESKFRVDNKLGVQLVEFTGTQFKSRVIGAEQVYGVQVPEYFIAALYVNGKLIELLNAGQHMFWRFGRDLRVEFVDMRLLSLEVAGQEILTKDKVSLRLNLVAAYRVIDVRVAYGKQAKPAEYLYKELQFGLRAAVGTRTLDELLENKGIIDEVVFAHGTQAVEGFGLALESVGVKDIILPGEMKTLLTKVVEAEKAAQANVIRRREETAATRSLLNTAKVMEDNPVALRLKELETLERVTEKIDKISVFGGLDGVLKDLVKIR